MAIMASCATAMAMAASGAVRLAPIPEVRQTSSARALVLTAAPATRRKDSIGQWELCKQSCASRARVTCIGGGDKRDAARKALEAALGEKKEVFSKWDEEIKKRETGGGGGGGRGRGWGKSGGGGGGGGDGGESAGSSNNNSWEEPKQMILAFSGLAALYLVLTQGKSMLAVVVNSMLFVLRGFKSSSGASSRREPELSGRLAPDGPGPAETSVISKWGKD